MKYLLILMLFISCKKESRPLSEINAAILGVYDKSTNEQTEVVQNGRYLKITWDWHDDNYLNKNNRTWDSVVLNSDNTFTVNEVVTSKYFDPVRSIGTGSFTSNTLQYKISIDGFIIFTGIKRP